MLVSNTFEAKACNMANSRNKKPANLSFKDRLTHVIKTKEAEERALKKMIEKLEEATAKKPNQNNKGDYNLK